MSKTRSFTSISAGRKGAEATVSRMQCKQGSLLTLRLARVGGKEGGIGKTRPYTLLVQEAFGKRLVASGEASL
jgi:hypothetical protein